MRRHAPDFLALAGLAGLITILPANPASARPTGEPQECSNCHYQNEGPTLAVVFSNSTPEPGELIDITIDIEANNDEALRTGLFLSSMSGEGSFTLIESEATRYAEEGDTSAICQAMPRDLDADGRAQFQVQWTAPETVGVTDFVLWSITGNTNGTSDDDNHATIVQGIAHGCDALTYYLDTDGDGYGDESNGQLSCDPIPGRIEQGGDCDDGDVEVFPGAAERCNVIDDNCNGEIDDGLEPGLYYPDPDGDGYAGDVGDPEFMCNDTPGFTKELGDCEPENPDVYPGAPEVENGEDDDCDGEIDEDIEESGSDGGDESGGDESGEGSGGPFVPGADGDSSAQGCSVGGSGMPGGLAVLCLFGIVATASSRRRGA